MEDIGKIIDDDEQLMIDDSLNDNIGRRKSKSKKPMWSKQPKTNNQNTTQTVVIADDVESTLSLQSITHSVSQKFFSSSRKGGARDGSATSSVSSGEEGKEKKKIGCLRWSLGWFQSLFCACFGWMFVGKSLRTQLLVGFGLVVAASLTFIGTVSTVYIFEAGDTVVMVGSENMQRWAEEKIGTNARYLADIATTKIQALEGLTLLLDIITQERFTGYPNSTTTTTDSYVPFLNYLSQDNPKANVYPLRATNKLPFLDDQLVLNVNESNSVEHVQQRFKWYGGDSISTVDASFFVRGISNPLLCDATMSFEACINVTNPTSRTPTIQSIYDKVADYASPVLKAFYEYHQEVKTIQIHFVNDGQGASVTFPGRRRQSYGAKTYTSIGCDWLKQINPRTQRPFGTQRQIDRCHPSGTIVDYATEFNALEQAWCRDQATSGAFLSLEPLVDNDGLWQIPGGGAVFDTMTNELIACVLIENSIQALLAEQGEASDDPLFQSRIAFTRWDEQGTVLLTSRWAAAQRQSNNSIGNTPAPEFNIVDMVDEYGVDQALWEDLQQAHMLTYNNATGRFSDLMELRNGYYVGAHPFPPLSPSSSYRQPEFMAFFCVPESDLGGRVASVREQVDRNSIIFSFAMAGTGVVSLLFSLTVIYLASLYLTGPLDWMNKIGSKILHSAGTTSSRRLQLFSFRKSCESFQDEGSKTNPKQGDDDVLEQLKRKPWSYRLSPPTEITRLVDEFQTMVLQFAGHGTAKLRRQDFFELQNPFMLSENFAILYARRADDSFRFKYIEPPPPHEESDIDAPRNFGNQFSDGRLHYGPNTHRLNEDDTERSRLRHSLQAEEIEERSPLRSPIFWWIVVCVAIPLIAFIVVMSMFVLIATNETLPILIEDLEDTYTNLERSMLLSVVRFRASYASLSVSIAIRDLYVFNRLAGWLFFGGIHQSNSLTEMVSGAERCKDFGFVETCPFVQNTPITACDCAWKDPVIKTCVDNYTDSRLLQKVMFEGLREDADPVTGDRNSTSYPEVGLFPNQTQFWPTIESLPGSEAGYNSSGYLTTFDRVRTLSALAMIQIPLYNYVQGTDLSRTWGTFTIFQADGMFSAYVGCVSDHVHLANWQAVNDTRIRGRRDLCPVGKYGIDGRCIRYLIEGKRIALAGLGTAPLYVTVPSQIPSDNNREVQSRAILPLIDPRTGELVAQNHVRISLRQLWEVLEDQTNLGAESFRLVSRAGAEANGDDDLIQLWEDPLTYSTPEKHLAGIPLAEVVLPLDGCTENPSKPQCRDFAQIVDAIHDGKTEQRQFIRTGLSRQEELINFNLAPIELTSYRPVNASDFSRGTYAYTRPVFALAFAQTEEAVLNSFSSVSSEISRTQDNSLIAMAIVMLLAIVVVVIVSWFVALSIAIPVAQLCELVTMINRSHFHAEFPELEGGPYEVVNVRKTFEFLHLLVRAGNNLYFAGRLGKACKTYHDALILFTKLQNEKAIGIANNNLGNTMLSIYRTMKKTSAPSMNGLDIGKVVERGVTYFKRAIDAGEDALKRINDDEGFSENYLIFMQQLSNRYFNRAMFLLTVLEDHPNSIEAKSQGLMDLNTCKDMDREVVDNGDREGFKGGKDVYFDLLLSRIKGLLLLMKIGYEDYWDIDDLFDGAREALMSALKTPDHILFREIEPAGQMQRLDAALIEYYLMLSTQKDEPDDDYEDEVSGYRLAPEESVDRASEIAIRMMVEDDYVIGEAAMLALKALTDKTLEATANDLGGTDPSDVRSALFQYRHRISEAMSLSYAGKDLMSRECFVAANLGDISMEKF